MLEVGDIKLFKKAGNFASYCRRVDSGRFSNGKKKGSNNHKNGNKYLSWAFVEAAHSIIRYNKTAHRFYQRKRDQRTCTQNSTSSFLYDAGSKTFRIRSIIPLTA
jgi:transposase